MHDGVRIVMPATAAGVMMPHTTHHTMAPLAAASDGHDRCGARDPAQHGPQHGCTCLGACCTAVAVLPTPPTPVTLAMVEEAVLIPTGRPDHEYVAAWVDFVLPFATAPPTQG